MDIALADQAGSDFRCAKCQRVLSDLPTWTSGVPSSFPRDVGDFITALGFGPSSVVCPACNTINRLPVKQRFHRRGLAELLYTPALPHKNQEASHEDPQFRAEIIQILHDDIMRFIQYTWAGAESRGRPGLPPASYFGVFLLYAIGVLRITQQDDYVNVGTSYPDSDQERLKTVYAEGAVAFDAIARVWGTRSERASSFDRFLRLAEKHVAALGDEPWPLSAVILNTIATAANAFGERLNVVERYYRLGVLSILAYLVGGRNPLSSVFSRAAVRFEFSRDANEKTAVLKSAILDKIIDRVSVLAEVQVLGQTHDFARYSEEGDQIVATITRLLGAAEAKHWATPVLNIESKTDTKRRQWVTDHLLQSIASLPDPTRLDALVAGAARANHDIGAELLDAVRNHADMERESFGQLLRCACEYFKMRPKTVVELVEGSRFLLPQRSGAAFNPVSWSVAFKYAEALRIQARAEEALALFLRLEREALDSESSLAARQGVGSSYRVLGRLRESEEVLTQVVSESAGRRRAYAVNALCTLLMSLGRLREATTLCQKNETLISGIEIDSPIIFDFSSNYSMLLSKTGKHQEAEDWRDCAVKAAQALNKPVHQFLASGSLLSDHGMTVPEVLELAEEVPLGDIVETEAQTLLARGLLGEADDLLAKAIERLSDALPAGAVLLDHVWRLWTLRAAVAAANVEGPSALIASAVVAAVEALTQLLAILTDRSDPDQVFSPRESDLRLLSMNSYFSVQNGDVPAEFLRTVADLVAAPVLTTRLVRECPDESALTRENLAAYWQETPATLVQVLEAGPTLVLVVSEPGEGAGLGTVRYWGLDLETDKVERITKRLIFHVSIGRVHPTGLNLDRVRGWPELEAALTAIAAASNWRPLVISPGPLAALPFALALAGTDCHVSFVPSLRALLSLRARRRRLTGGINARPKDFHDFVVWRQGDDPDVVSALLGSVEDGRTMAATHALGYSNSVGLKATGEALKDAMHRSDMLRLSCHGHLNRKDADFELLVAAGGELPPSLVEVSQKLCQHRLNWRALADVGDGAPFIFSSACDSGVAVSWTGGERFGLERPLFAGGTIAFAAPLWPVHAASMRGYLGFIIDNWFRNQDVALDTIVWYSRERARREGVRIDTVESLALFGDVVGSASQGPIILTGDVTQAGVSDLRVEWIQATEGS